MPEKLQGHKIGLHKLLGLYKTNQKLRGLKVNSIPLQGLLTESFSNIVGLCGTQLDFSLACNSAHVVTAGF